MAPINPLLAVLLTVVMATAATGCGGNGGTAFPAAGHASPPAAVAGFFAEATAGRSGAACTFVLPADAQDCAAGVAAAGLTAPGIHAGAVSVIGDQAVVTVLGKVCVNGDAGQSCTTNHDPEGGQPSGPGVGAFDAAYQQAVSGTGGNDPAIPCRRTASGWFVDLGRPG